MLSKILWSICGLLIILGAGFLVFKYKIIINRPQVLGTNVYKAINTTAPVFDKIPTKINQSSDPNILSKAAYLMDADTAYPLYSQEADEKLPVASLTKMITALVVLENHPNNLQDEVTITYKMIAVVGTDIQLKPGEKMLVENLLNGLLIMSGNDTANALAEHFGGKDPFVKEMNEKAKTIGAINTSFQDPAGLSEDGYSTAKDLALIITYAIKNSKFLEIINTPKKTITTTDGLYSHDLVNSNRLIREEEGAYYYPYAIGGKTGFTNEAGHVMVTCAEKDKHKIIAVVLNTNESSITASAKESKKLLEWGFTNWTW